MPVVPVQGALQEVIVWYADACAEIAVMASRFVKVSDWPALTSGGRPPLAP